ncbi:hypothetical protein [Paenisporosarcina sp. TG20]|uniref:hypothetical protein n=1 Tax=Paenisporosarcina sp. TG20 TaxID=1211706 RepID=UPI0012F6DD6A|nr:hypothetical protein [Paenisporosarcina sp. TG20]
MKKNIMATFSSELPIQSDKFEKMNELFKDNSYCNVTIVTATGEKMEMTVYNPKFENSIG